MRTLLSFLLLSLMACAGTPEVDPAQKEMEKRCRGLYGSSTKVLQDFFYQKGVAEVKFVGQKEYTEKCAGMGFTIEHIKCLDPNLADESCKETLKPVEAKQKELMDFLTSPMMDKKKDEKKATPAEGEAGGADKGAEKPAEGASP